VIRDRRVRVRSLGAVAAAATLVALPGCASWRPEPPPEPAISVPPVTLDGRYRITLRNGESIVVEYPTFEPDSVRGIRVRTKRAGISGIGGTRTHRAHWAVAREDVVAIELRKAETGDTVLLIAGIAGLTAFLAALPWIFD
jgi:hypothetical protein